MGFDIECIIDIHNYPGEYFCPVCRTLVYPHEALQSQCTHLYCKPCLAHVANGTKACPYDGYLVTEADSKPLMESDKAMAENVGKVKVHCLFFRSGCTWEGALADCTTHCSGCTFGNSPVICNRCGIQIVHRQVHEHAQTCPGGYEAQQAVGGVSAATGLGTASATTTAEMNQTVTQPGAALPQAQNFQNAAANLVPVQNPNPQISGSSSTSVVATGAVPTQDNWYQQQYQHYYQQYAGYASYQQPSHPYYPPQQPSQQYQQHPVVVQGHTLPPPQPQAQLQQHQPHPAPQTPQQPHTQPQAQGQAQAQVQVQGQAQQQPQLQPLPQVRAPIQALAPNYQANAQQQPLAPMLSHLPHTVPPPPPHGQPVQYAQGMGMQPPAQRPHVPQYQQPAVQMHPQASQTHVQAQMHPQPLPLPPPPPPPLAQTSNQSYVQPQPQVQQYHNQSQPHFRPPPPQPNQLTVPVSLSHAPHTTVPPVSGHLSYQQPHPAPLQSGFSQQQPVHPHPTGGNLHPVQFHGQAPQQSGVMMQPPHSLGHQQFPPHVQQSSHSFQHRPAVQPVQQAVPQQYAQQPFPAPFQGHGHQQSHFPPQQPMQPSRPYAPSQSQPPQNYVGRPTMPYLGVVPQANPQASGGADPVQPSDLEQIGLKQTSRNQNNAESTMLEHNTTRQEGRSPPKGLVEMGSEVVSVKTGSDVKQHESSIRNEENAAKDGLTKPSIKQEEDGSNGSLKLASGGRPSETGVQEDGLPKAKSNMLTDPDSMKQADLENQEKSNVTGLSSPYFGKESRTAVSASSTEGHVQPPKSHGPHQLRPQAQMPGQSPSIVGPLGPGILAHPGQGFNPTEGRGSGYFGPPPKGFVSPSFPQGPSLAGSADPHGFTGRAPQPRFEGQFGPQHSGRPSDNAVLKDQRPDEEGNFRQTYGNEPSFLRRNGGTAMETSMFGLQDEKMKAFSGERMNPFLEPAQMLDQGSIGKMPHGPNHEPGSKFNPSLGSNSQFFPPHRPVVHGRMDDFGTGPGFGQRHLKHPATRSPDREYHEISPRRFGGPSIFPRGSSAFDDVNGNEASRFGEGSRYFNQSWDHGNPFHDGRFPPLSGHPRRADVDGPENLRFGEQMAPRPLHNYNRSDDVFVKDGPGHLMRGEFSGPGYFSGNFKTAEASGSGAFHSHARATELGGPGNFPGMWNNHFAGGMDSYDPSRKRRSMSTGWCRICKVDCETVEGLDMHSQSIEHQRTTMDMVKSIKQQNRKKQRSSGGHIAHDGGRARKVGHEYRGNKH